MAYGGLLVTSRPETSTLPARGRRKPMMEFIVVVLPAPLRPSSATSSPAFTSSETPCKMWLSP